MKYSTVSYLMHHGVQGQKWGVRRWQNPDGSLTPLGRQHYGLNKLDYDSKFEGTRGEGRRAYKKERKQLMGNLKSARNSIDNEIKGYASDSGAQALRNDSSTKSYVKEIEKRLGTKISDVDDPELYDLIAQDMEAEGMKVPKGVLDKIKNSSGFDEQYYNSQSAIADKTYQKGQKEVDNYLAGKYGEEIISSYNKGKKAKTIAIGAGVVAGSTILGMGVWHGTKAYKNNQLREFEDSAYDKADHAYGAYEKAKNYREWARNRENEAKKDSDKMWKQYVHDSDYNTRSANKAGYRWAEENYKDAKRDADKAYYQQEDARNKAIENSDYYDKVAKERAGKAQGLWRRKSDDERDNRYTEFMKRHI